MTIRYIEPLSRAFGRMKKALFQPFDIRKWFIVGFTAFLAELTECHRGSSGQANKKTDDFDLGDLIEFPHRAWNWLMDNPFWFGLIVFGILLIVALVILFTWLSSRGKFMFLDNVVHDRALIAQPWRQYGHQANSLFLWRLAFGLICFLIFVGFLIHGYNTAAHFYESDTSGSSVIFTFFGQGLALILFFMVAGFIAMLLNSFIVPIMYKHDQSACGAWSAYLPLLTRHFIHFMLYGILVLFLHILIVIGVVLGGLFTCCLGFILLIIPYIGSVVLLPVSYTLRAFSLEYLGQFDPDLILFQDEAAQIPNASSD